MHDKAPAKMGKVIPLFESVPYEKSMARLARATARMEEAIMEQQESVAVFRSTMAELRDRTERLGESCEFLHHTVGRIGVKPLRDKSLRLARIMESDVLGAICGPRPATEPTC